MKKKKEKKHVEPQQELEPVRDSEGEPELEKMEIDGETFSSLLPQYIPPRKRDAKPVTDSKDSKYGTFTPLLLELV